MAELTLISMPSLLIPCDLGCGEGIKRSWVINTPGFQYRFVLKEHISYLVHQESHRSNKKICADSQRLPSTLGSKAPQGKSADLDSFTELQIFGLSDRAFKTVIKDVKRRLNGIKWTMDKILGQKNQ